LAHADVEPAVELISALLISQPITLFTLGVQQSWSDEQISERVEVAMGMFGRCFMSRAAAS
jgi:TetR/AcrR family transcriptional repressor of mexJK operon